MEMTDEVAKAARMELAKKAINTAKTGKPCMYCGEAMVVHPRQIAYSHKACKRAAHKK